jgi:hypothetical protein
MHSSGSAGVLIMESLLRKKLLITLTLVSLYFLYVSIRIKDKREYLRYYRYSRLNEYECGGPVALMKKCKAMGLIFITIEKGLGQDTFERNAKYLFKTEFGIENVCKTTKIDICNSENCATMDIKYFILQYFRELEKRGVILRKRDSISNKYTKFVYDIIPDSVELKEDSKKSKELKEGLKTFGMMLGLAMIHMVYMEIRFEEHFLISDYIRNVEKLFSRLEELDPEQYKVYNDIKNDHDNMKTYKFVSNSTKPFRTSNDPDPLAIEYSSSDYPFDKAFSQIFIDPFVISRDLIFEGMKKVCYSKYFTTSDYYVGGSSVNLNSILSESYYEDLIFYDLKDNIDLDKNSKLFLRALKLLEDYEVLKVYQKVTGFKHIPVGGISRLPRIKIVSGSSELFPRPFLIVIPPGIDEQELKQKLIESTDQHQEELNN